MLRTFAALSAVAYASDVLTPYMELIERRSYDGKTVQEIGQKLNKGKWSNSEYVYEKLHMKSTCCFEAQNNVDAMRAHFKSPEASPADCESECNADEGCKFFSHSVNRKQCILCSSCEFFPYGAHRDFTAWAKRTPQTAATSTFLGCYKDGGSRDLKVSARLITQGRDDGFEPAGCAHVCGALALKTLGFEYQFFRLQHHHCYCGNDFHTVDRYHEVPLEECSKNGRDPMLGSDWRNSVFSLRKTPPRVVDLLKTCKETEHGGSDGDLDAEPGQCKIFRTLLDMQHEVMTKLDSM